MSTFVILAYACLKLFAFISAQPPPDTLDTGIEPVMLPGSDIPYNMARYWTWYDWINQENTRNVPAIPSQIWAAGHRVAIDVVPMPEDADGGRRFHLWIYRFRIPNRISFPGFRSRMIRLREWAFGLRRPLSYHDRIVQEGPFIIQPANPQEDAIAMISGPTQPAWAVEMLGRPLMGFRVRQVGTVYHLNRGVTGSAWLRYPGDSYVISHIISNRLGFAIHAAKDVTDLSGKTIIFTIYSLNPHAWVCTDHDTRQIPTEGPWRVRCASDRDVILLKQAEEQPQWVISALGKADSGNPSPLRDFEIIARDEDMDSGTYVVSHMRPNRNFLQVIGVQGSADEHNMVAIRRYQTQCLRINTEQFFQNTQIVEEHYVTAVGVVRTYHGGTENLIEEDNGLAPHPQDLAMAESIEVRVPGRDIPIAQTVHTDNLDFRFESPERQNGFMSYLLFCAFAGGQDLKLSYEKLPIS